MLGSAKSPQKKSYTPNLDMQYLQARYYSPSTANFLTEASYLGDINDPLTLNRYNYVKSSPLNYIDPSGNAAETVLDIVSAIDSAITFISNPSWTSVGFLLWNIAPLIYSVYRVHNVKMWIIDDFRYRSVHGVQ